MYLLHLRTQKIGVEVDHDCSDPHDDENGSDNGLGIALGAVGEGGGKHETEDKRAPEIPCITEAIQFRSYFLAVSRIDGNMAYLSLTHMLERSLI
jgi:hypothetical protein